MECHQELTKYPLATITLSNHNKTLPKINKMQMGKDRNLVIVEQVLSIIIILVRDTNRIPSPWSTANWKSTYQTLLELILKKQAHPLFKHKEDLARLAAEITRIKSLLL